MLAKAPWAVPLSGLRPVLSPAAMSLPEPQLALRLEVPAGR
jgi:hypothetical protein